MGSLPHDGSRSGQPYEDYDEYRRRIKVRISFGQQVPPETLEHLLHTPAAFEAWLRGQPPVDVVGDYHTPDDSPLANFIWDALGVYVDTFDVIFDGKSFHEMPAWCAAFTREEAVYIEQHSHEGGNELTAAEVLDILHLHRVVERE